MIDRNTPSDPRLRERRGDLVGLNAILFAIVLFAAIGVIGFIFLKYVPAGAAPTNPPSSGFHTASASPSAVPSASASILPSPSVSTSASPSPTPTFTQGPAITVKFGVATPLMVGGQQVGTVTVVSLVFMDKAGTHPAPPGSRWAVVKVHYEATATIHVAAGDWELLDVNRHRADWSGYDPSPALGNGTLKAGEKTTGYVSFKIGLAVGVRSIILRTPDGKDMIIFTAPRN